MTKRILVYGSLRRGQQAHRFMRNTTFVEEVRVPGYDLFDLGWYPGIKPNPENKIGIVGEVFELMDGDDETVRNLDAFEGYNPKYEKGSSFVRKEIAVNGLPTMLYEYNRNTDAPLARKVPSGDWNKRDRIMNWYVFVDGELSFECVDDAEGENKTINYVTEYIKDYGGDADDFYIVRGEIKTYIPPKGKARLV